MKKYIGFSLILAISSLLFSTSSISDESSETQVIRVLTWEGYVTDGDISRVNQLLQEQGYGYHVEVISPYAEGAEQMYNLIRGKECDITFLTLFFIKMKKEQTAKLLQPVNIDSPRLTNYQHLYPNLTRLKMGVDRDGLPLYIPWGGGIYGFYIDHDRVTPSLIPYSVKALWQPEWRHKFSLNGAQEWYNIGLTLMSQGESPFYLYEEFQKENRSGVMVKSAPDGAFQTQLTALYDAAGSFWTDAPTFNDELLIVSSWGPEIHAENVRGGNWELIDFEEGHMAWLDTINFVKGLSGRKLEAAEIFANYFIGKEVQNRISNELSMVPASQIVPVNTILGDPDKILNENMFVPPYDQRSYGLMKKMLERAKKQRQP
ncbi:extracellular solute-binding protein [Shewanella nanhaiensis]|uniref:Extracellular solute-binding protein n=1 Tax=Shewanella nanhaiensis TaxID=2864872 RepID=A0ABS7EAB2_9GAMM|nr:extracellular solute-binding protein [Shewanella nanhaiensis]MBW8186607.1 extracellular solute-binding protein [Shewanella nanhaiensis]